jgi:hypothetical protein
MPVQTPDSQPLLFIIGLGVKVPEHVTAQATMAMLRCTQIYSIVQEAPNLWLPSGKAGEIAVVSALRMYREGDLRSDNYQRTARAIVDAAAVGRTVGYVTYGNPMAYDSVAQNIIRFASEVGIKVEVIPGISSVDTLLCDLTFDMAPGVQIYEASWLIAFRIPLQVTTAAILFQIGSFGSLRTHYSTRPDARSLRTLVDYLCRFYPPSHQVFLVMSSMLEQRTPRIRRVALEDLCGLGPEASLGGSMYIPVLREPEPDVPFIAKMEQI